MVAFSIRHFWFLFLLESFKLLLFSHFCAVLYPSRVTIQAPQWTGKWIEEPDQNKTMENNEVKEKHLKDNDVIKSRSSLD